MFEYWLTAKYSILAPALAIGLLVLATASRASAQDVEPRPRGIANADLILGAEADVGLRLADPAPEPLLKLSSRMTVSLVTEETETSEPIKYSLGTGPEYVTWKPQDVNLERVERDGADRIVGWRIIDFSLRMFIFPSPDTPARGGFISLGGGVSREWHHFETGSGDENVVYPATTMNYRGGFGWHAERWFLDVGFRFGTGVPAYRAIDYTVAGGINIMLGWELIDL